MDDLLNRAPCGFLTFSQDGTLELVNATLLEMLGYEGDELVGRHIETILTIGSRIFYQTHWFPLLRLHGRAEEIFLFVRAKSGEDVGVLVNASRVEQDGRVVYACVLMQVQERRKYEDELLRARRVAEEARAELEAQQKVLQDANFRLEAQASELELQQHQLEEQALELETASEELAAMNRDLRARTKEAERLREVAEEANRAKSTFLAVMSHELRTPLNAIAGYVQLLTMGIHGPVTDAQKTALGRIDRSQSHLLRLINDVLDLARIEAGRVDYAVEDVPVEEVVAGVAPMVEPQFTDKGIAFQVDLPPGLVMRADREKVQQILINLLGNAVKFTPRGGQVRIHALRPEHAPDRIVVSVSDTGVGIPADEVEKVFQPFVQVDSTDRGASEGSGLGLAISRDMARGMGGDLSATSEVGKGSSFDLSLPAASPAPAPEQSLPGLPRDEDGTDA